MEQPIAYSQCLWTPRLYSEQMSCTGGDNSRVDSRWQVLFDSSWRARPRRWRRWWWCLFVIFALTLTLTLALSTLAPPTCVRTHANTRVVNIAILYWYWQYYYKYW